MRQTRTAPTYFLLSGRDPLYGLEIAHSAVPDNILIVADTRDVTVGGRTFTALPFTVILPQDKDDESRPGRHRGR